MSNVSSSSGTVAGPASSQAGAPPAAGNSPGVPASLGTATSTAVGMGLALPEWCPPWAERLGDAYLSGTSCLFLLHGNVRDLVALAPPAAPAQPGREAPATAGSEWGTVSDFLSREMFGRWDIVLAYDVGKGLRPLAGPDGARLRSMVQWLTERLGNAATWPRDPDAAIGVIDALLERNLIDPPEQRKRIAIVLDYAQYLAPAGDAASSVKLSLIHISEPTRPY